MRLVLSVGVPDPDRLSTMLLWSLVGHVTVLCAAAILYGLGASSEPRAPSYFVRLTGPVAGPGGGSASRSQARSVSPATPPRAAAHPPEPAPARPAPTKASLAAPPEETPRTRERKPEPPRSAPAGERVSDEPHSSIPDPGSGHAPSESEGAGGGPTGPGAPGGTGGAAVGATSFGDGDFVFGWYQTRVENLLAANWSRPASVALEVQTATVSFVIRKAGAIEEVTLVAPSGNSALDLSALRAVYDSNPMPPLPGAWREQIVRVTMEFRLTPGDEP